MKKMLLVLALPLMLVGCSNGTTKEGQWRTLEKRQDLTVVCEKLEYTFDAGEYETVKFRVDYENSYYNYVTAIQVETVHSIITARYEFKGNVSYVLTTTVLNG